MLIKRGMNPRTQWWVAALLLPACQAKARDAGI